MWLALLGVAAAFVLPRPRVLADNFSFKIRTTPSGELPTDEDLFAIVSEGLPGTSMPPFDKALSEAERWDVVAYVKALSPDFSDPVYVVAIIPMAQLSGAQPPSSPEAVERGRQLYQENECFKCHGQQGRGDGPSWEDLEDDWDDPILPANFANAESFRGGSTAFDVYRAVSTGLNGTPMPSFADSLSPEEIWDLAHYVVSLASPRDTDDETLRALAVDAIPEDWSGVPVARFPTVPNLIEAPRLYFQAVEFVSLQAVYTSEELALRVQWDDRTASTGTDAEGTCSDRDGGIYRGTRHPDQLAIQLPARPDEGARPYRIIIGSNRVEDVLEIRFEDDGPGFRPEALERGFEPLFTTRAEGAGLGLAIVSRLAAAHGAEAVLGEGRHGGAAVTLRWPIDAERRAVS
ncbi:MAG TPA: c-type cytochrome [Myxococcota bacterium]|nr:c-type cytochrome [Myxococcota bacterium]